MTAHSRPVRRRFRTLLGDYWIPFLIVLLALLSGVFLAWVVVLQHLESAHDADALHALTTFRTELTAGHLWFEEYVGGDESVLMAQVSTHLDSAGSLGHSAAVHLRGAETDALTPTVDSLHVRLDRFEQSLDSLASMTAVRLAQSKRRGAVDIDHQFDSIYVAVMSDARVIKGVLESRLAAGKKQQQEAVGGLFVIWVLMVLLGLAEIRRRKRRRLRDALTLRESEARFRELAGLLPVGVFETTLDGTLVYANRDLARRCGLDQAAIDRRVSLVTAIAPDERDRARAWLTSLAGREAVDAQEFRMVAYDGSIFTANLRVGSIFAEDQPVGLRGIIADISEPKEAEHALRREKEKYQTLMRVAPVGILRLDDNAGCTYVNDRGAGLFGLSVTESLGHGWLAGIHPEHRKQISVEVQTAIRKGAPWSRETCSRHKDGSLVWFDINIEPEFDESGAIVMYVGSIVDITARRQTEEKLKDSEVRFKRLSEAAFEGVIIHDNGILLDMNEAFAKMLGGTVKDFVGTNIFDRIHPDYRKIVHDTMAAGYDTPLEILGLGADGNPVPVEIVGRTMPFEGKTVRVVAIRDIRERTQAREEISKFKTITDIADYGSAITDLDGNFIYVNQQYATMHGFEPEELIGSHLSVCHDLDRLPDFDDRIAELVRTGRTPTGEVWHKHRSGGSFPTLQSATVVTDDNGNPRYLAGTVMDISDLKESERKLQELAAIPENYPNLVLTISAGGELLYLNPSARKLLVTNKKDPAEIWDWLPRDARDIIDECARSGRSMQDQQAECDGHYWSWAFYGVEGQPVVHCYGQDVTGSQQQQRENRRLSAAVMQSANVIVITDIRGRIEYVNPQFTAVTGYEIDEVIGRRVSLLKSGQHDRRFYSEMWKTIKAGKIWTGRMHNRRKDGSLYWERKTISAIFDADGEVVNYVSVGDDITIELQTQQKLAESDKMSAIGMLAAGVAHEFKNYLGGIIGNASFALEELEADTDIDLARDTLTQIIEMGDRANDVAMSLLSYSKARPDDFTNEDLRKIITRSISLVEKEMKNLSIEIVTYFEEAPKVEVSASKIQQLLLNLLINAQHAIEEDGVISVSLFARADHIQIKVADSGVGIPEDSLSRIFDPFYSTKGVWGKDELVGTGMGLSICRNIAREHNGDLTVESVVGIGTNFTLTIPLVQSEDPLGVAAEVTDRRNLRVLIFALQKTILAHYFPAACETDARLLWVDAVAHIGDQLDRVADLVVLDAKFSGKVELLRMVEMCREYDVPYVMVNCGVMEYQLAELYESSRANFKELPDFGRLVRHGLKASKAAVTETEEDSSELL